MHRRLGLHVTELVDPVVHQGEHGDAGRAGLRQPAQVAVEEVTALAAEQHHGAPVAGGPLQVGRRRGDPGAGLGRARPDPVQLAAVAGVRLAGPEVPVRRSPCAGSGRSTAKSATADRFTAVMPAAWAARTAAAIAAAPIVATS